MRHVLVVSTALVLIYSNVTLNSQASIAIPGIIQLEDYSSSSDVSVGNEGGGCRSDSVDLSPSWDAPDTTGCILTHTEATEWLGFNISVAQSNTYVLSARLAHPGAGGTFHIEIDGVDVTGPISVPSTGSFGHLQTIHRHGIYVAAGAHTLTLVMDTVSSITGSVGNFNYLTLAVSAPYTTPAAVPGRIEAEHYDRNPTGESGQAIAYHDATSANIGGSFRIDEAVDIGFTSDVDGLYNVGWTERAEWLGYTITVATTGYYTFHARVAHPGPGGVFHMEVDGVDATGSLFVPDTGGWHLWQTVTSQPVFISAGQHVVYVVVDVESPLTGALANVNWFSFSSASAPISVSCGNPNDLLPDDNELQWCLDNLDEVVLEPPQPGGYGYIVNGRPKTVGAHHEPHGLGLVVSRSGQHITASSRSTHNRAVINAGRQLAGFILESINKELTIEYVQFHGAVDLDLNPDPDVDDFWRLERGQCGLTDTSGNPLRPLLQPGNLNLSSTPTGRIVLMHNEVRDALCGSGAQIQGNLFVWDNYIGHNGDDQYNDRPDLRWSDGITALWCNGHIIENTFVDNTDIQLALGGGPCVVRGNIIASFGKFAFAGLNPGAFANNFGAPGDHSAAIISDNRAYTGPNIIDKQFMGILVGAHPWNSAVNVSNTGAVYRNASYDNVMNIVVEGVFGGRIGFDELGTAQPNSAAGNRVQGAHFGQCRETVNYSVHDHPQHVAGIAPLLQAGYTFMRFDDGTCTF